MEQPEKTLPQHPVRLVAERTGLSPHVLRVWERRYQVVAPERSAGGQRLYSDADIERLRLLGVATQAGRNISQLVALPNDQLLDLIRADQEAERRTRPSGVSVASGVVAEEGDLAVARLMEAVEALDGPALEGGLRQAVVTFGMHGAIDAVIHPLLVEIGERWHDGDLPPQHEHFATATVRRVLDGLVHELSVGSGARPRILVATPAGQRHELGALLVAATAAALGWRVTYLGIDLPVSDIAAAAETADAQVVALSVVYPTDDALLAADLHRLVTRLQGTRTLVLGGSGAAAYLASLPASTGVISGDLATLRATLQRLGGRQAAW